MPFAPEAPPVEQAPSWPKPDTADAQDGRRAGADHRQRSRHRARDSVRLQTLPDAYVRWTKSNVRRQRQAGYVCVTARLPLGDFTAGQAQVLADLADAYGDGTVRLSIDQNVLFRWVPASGGPRLLRAARRRRARNAGCGHDCRRDELPGRGDLPSRRDPVARIRSSCSPST